MVRVAFLSPELPRWDAAAADGLIAWVFADERPARGVAGLLDWRLCGRVSRWLVAGRLRGDAGEALLFPPEASLPFRMAMLLGFGPLHTLDEASFARAILAAHDRARRAGLHRYVMGLPGRTRGTIRVRRAIEIFLDCSEQVDADVLLVEPPSAQKEMADVMRCWRPGGDGRR